VKGETIRISFGTNPNSMVFISPYKQKRPIMVATKAYVGEEEWLH
jgi:hypothetical protein